MIVHPDDVLIVGFLGERRDHRDWPALQVVSCSMPARLEGRRIRNAWYTPGAVARTRDWERIYSMLGHMTAFSGGTIRPINELKPNYALENLIHNILPYSDIPTLEDAEAVVGWVIGLLDELYDEEGVYPELNAHLELVEERLRAVLEI